VDASGSDDDSNDVYLTSSTDTSSEIAEKAMEKGHKSLISFNEEGSQADLLSLFVEYCMLSEAYREAGGWALQDAYDATKKGGNGGNGAGRQVDVARQHLSWMLGKSGHGRLVRYKYGLVNGGGGSCLTKDGYEKHVHILRDLNEATCIEDLLIIARKCLVEAFPGVREIDHPSNEIQNQNKSI